MRGQPAPGIARGTLAGQRLIVPENLVFNDIEPAVLAAFEAALARLVAEGVKVERRSLPAFDAIFDLIRRPAARHGGGLCH